MKKNILIYTLFILPLPLLSNEGARPLVEAQPPIFDLSQKINKTSEISDTFELIASCHGIAQQICDDDSTRLAKKMFKIIKNLHIICSDEQDAKIKLAYKNLLGIAMANEKLTSVDYTDELPVILNFYANVKETTSVIKPGARPPIEAQPLIEETPVEELTNAQRSERVEKLYEKLANLNRNSIIPKLSLKKIINDMSKLSRDIHNVQKKVSLLSEQEDILNIIYKKLLNIEKLLMKSSISGQLTRFPVLIDEDDAQLLEYQEY
jgi:hypothetical protein